MFFTVNKLSLCLLMWKLLYLFLSVSLWAFLGSFTETATHKSYVQMYFIWPHLKTQYLKQLILPILHAYSHLI